MHCWHTRITAAPVCSASNGFGNSACHNTLYSIGLVATHICRIKQAVRALRARCHAFLLQQLPPDAAHAAAAAAGDMAATHAPPPDGRWGLGSFTIERGMHQPSGVRRSTCVAVQPS